MATLAGDLSLNFRLSFLLHDVSRIRRNVVDRALKPLGLTRSQWSVLVFLSRRDGMPQVVLAEELDLSKVAIGGLVDRLAASGFVERRGDAIDLRVKRVFLTKTGRKLVKAIREHVSGVEDLIIEGIDDAEVVAMIGHLRRMKSNLLRLLEDGPPGSPEMVLADGDPGARPDKG